MNCPICSTELRLWKKARRSGGRSHSQRSCGEDLYICPVGEKERPLVEHADGTCERVHLDSDVHGEQGERIWRASELES